MASSEDKGCLWLNQNACKTDMEGGFPEDRNNPWMSACPEWEENRAKLPEASASPTSCSKLLAFLQLQKYSQGLNKGRKTKQNKTFPSRSCVGDSSSTCSWQVPMGTWSLFLLQPAWKASRLQDAPHQLPLFGTLAILPSVSVLLYFGAREKANGYETKAGWGYLKWGKNLNHKRKQWIKQAATKAKLSMMVNKELGISVPPGGKD